MSIEQSIAAPILLERASESKEHRYEELDSVRGIAALTVIVGHFLTVWKTHIGWHYFNASPLRIIAAGHEAVVLFFLLSGFVLAIPYGKKNPPTYQQFLVRRICRIYFPYVAAVVLAAAADHSLYSTVPTGNPWIDQTWNQRPTTHLVLQHFLMIGHFDTAQLNTAFWSLVYEMRISIIYPVLYWLAYRISAPTLLISTFVTTIAAALCAQRFGSEGFFYDFLYAGFFVVGVLLQKHIAQASRWCRSRSLLWQLTMALLAIVCFDGPGALPAFQVFGSNLLFLYLADWTTLCGAVLILLFAINIPPFRRLLHHPVILRMGAISYSAYLVHATVLFVLIRLYLGRAYFPWLFPLYIAATYLVSEIFHALIERPSTLLGRKLGGLMQSRESSLASHSQSRAGQ